MEIAITIMLPLFAGFLVGLAINLPYYIEGRRQLRETKREIAEQEKRILAIVQSSQSFKRK